jgi:hypothetical protein
MSAFRSGRRLFALLVLSGSASAGGELSGTYSFASLGARLSTCSTADVRTQLCSNGVVTFQPGGTFTISGTDRAECVDGGTSTSSFGAPGTYTLGANGLLVLDLNPSSPGTDTFRCRIDSTRDIIVSADLEFGAPDFLVGVRRGSGMSTADLAGEYYIVSSSLEVDLGPNPGQPGNPEDLRGRGVVTDAVFSGAGTWSESGTAREFGPSGGTFGAVTDGGPYSVNPNGTLNLGAGTTGAISPDGSFGFALSIDTATWGQRFDLALAVRKPGSAPAPAVFDGTWALGVFDNQLLAGDLTRQYQVAGVATVDAVPSGSFISITGSEVYSDPFGGGSSSIGDAGTLVPGSSGQVTFGSESGWIDAGGRVMLFGDNTSPGATNMILALRVEEPVGTAFCFGDGAGSACPCGNENGGSRASGRAGCAGSAGTGGGALGAAGSASVSDQFLHLVAEGVGPNRPCLFFQANNPLSGGNGNPVGGGLLCVGGGVKRLLVRFSDSGGTATSFGVNLPLLGGHGAGVTLNYQAWYRDPVPGGSCNAGFNFTNAVGISWLP